MACLAQTGENAKSLKIKKTEQSSVFKGFKVVTTLFHKYEVDKLLACLSSISTSLLAFVVYSSPCLPLPL